MGMLDGKVALITGGANGIGLGTAERFAEEGASVVLADMLDDDGEKAAELIRSRGAKAAYVHCDVSDSNDVWQAVDLTARTFGRVDIVFANAGINGVWTPLEELKPQEWNKTIAINLTGTYLTIHHSIPHLKQAGGGSVIITSSVNGNRTFTSAGASAYSTSKAGQVALMKMAALELGRYGVRVNAICPGAIETKIDDRTEKRDTEEVQIPMEFPEGMPVIHHGRGEPSHVADVCLFLASNLSRHVSGVEIYVDGGASLVR